MSQPLLAIYGPTASGKGRLALHLAERLDGEILVCDSMKIYRGMDIGTAKPTATMQARVPFHGIDLLSPTERFSAGRYRDIALAAIEGIRERNHLPILAGGTALYMKAITEGLFDGPEADRALRKRLRKEAEEKGLQHLHDRLRTLDPDAAEEIHPNDRKRVVRAIEVVLKTGEPISARQREFGQVDERWDLKLFAVRREQTDLDRRIDARVVRMMEAGFVDEVRTLLDDPGFGPQSKHALGYKETVQFLEGRGVATREELIALIQRRTRRFARKQITWLNRFPHAEEVRVQADESLEQVAERLIPDLEAWLG